MRIAVLVAVLLVSPLVRAQGAAYDDDDRTADTDGDGIGDAADACLSDPEDFDGFEDRDGCPDPDNDRDGVLDRNDACPNEPGVASARGCPVRDRDSDGVADSDDACPNEAGPARTRGCPVVVDSDGDGIADPDDRCRLQPETRNGYEDNDGCPDVVPPPPKPAAPPPRPAAAPPKPAAKVCEECWTSNCVELKSYGLPRCP